MKGTLRKRHKDRDYAGLKFVNNDLTAKEIATMFGVTTKTVGEWRKDDNWDEQKQINYLKPTQLIKRYYEQSELVIQEATKDKRKLTLPEVDMLTKLSKSISYLSSKGSDPQTIMQSLDGFMNYLSNIDLPLSQQIVEYVMTYVHIKMNERKQN